MKIAVVGAGGWGTALATIWSRRHRSIALIGKDPARIQALQQSRENKTYLPGVSIPREIRLTSDLQFCEEADLLVFSTPSTALREIIARIKSERFSRQRVHVVATGGYAELIAKRLGKIDSVHPNLTLEGLRIAANLNP